MRKEKSKLRRSATDGSQFCDSSCQRHCLVLKLNHSAKGSLSVQRFTRELPSRTHAGKVLQKDWAARVQVSKGNRKAI